MLRGLAVPGHGLGPGPSEQYVAPRARGVAGEGAGVTEQGVVAGTAVDPVDSAAHRAQSSAVPRHPVVAGTADQLVVAAARGIASGGVAVAGELVVPVASEEAVVAAARGVAGGAEAVAAQLVGAHRAVDGVVAESADQDVVARQPADQVVAALAVDRVRARSADDDVVARGSVGGRAGGGDDEGGGYAEAGHRTCADVPGPEEDDGSGGQGAGEAGGGHPARAMSRLDRTLMFPVGHRLHSLCRN